MLHLRPVSPKNAEPLVTGLYKDIAVVFAVENTPLPFQYLANFPDFFAYVWNKSILNLQSPVFVSITDQLVSVVIQATEQMYKPSQAMHEFVEKISPHEKVYLHKTASSVMQLNAKLLVLTIGMRESIKGVFIGQKLITGAATSSRMDEEEGISALLQPYTPRDVSRPEELGITSTSAFLAPLFSSSLAVSSLPHFFAHIDREMHLLIKTENYLEKRVLLEQQAMQASYRLPYPLGASYQELIRLAGGKPYFHELLSLLVETFPTAYPRMLFTTAVMLYALEGKHTKSLEQIS